MERIDAPNAWERSATRGSCTLRVGVMLWCVLAVVACGGGGGSADSAAIIAPDREQAARFLTQSTYGPTETEINRLTKSNLPAWIEDQFTRPQSLHRVHLDQLAAELAATDKKVNRTHFIDSYWKQAISGEDQLRQRAAFALSQIFVISFADAALRGQPRGVASYYDMLGEHAFGNFRNLLEAVTLHPMMGVYLTHLKNQKEDPAIGRVPDQNFAREITQLFTVGQYKLNTDGTIVHDVEGKPIPAVHHSDHIGLSKVFTGWSWYAGANLSDRTRRRFFGGNANDERDWRPMQPYNRFTPNTDFHSASEKTFFGVTIPAQSEPDPVGELKIALDTLFNQPNVGPFIGKQLIQRLVTSNPSPAYVGRVSAAFNNDGRGVRGDMKAVWRAVLLDPEARSFDAADTQYGKLREPVIRFANWMRAFNARSDSGRFTGIGNTDDPGTRLYQTPMSAPSVFNFYRPGYVPTSKVITDPSLVAPELQITHEVSVAGYANFLRKWIPVRSSRDIRQDYSAELALSEKPEALVDRMNLLLFSGQMSDALRTQLIDAVESRSIPAARMDTDGSITNQDSIDRAKRDRVHIAVFLSMVSPDYLIQR